jgi:hypothetical protein
MLWQSQVTTAVEHSNVIVMTLVHLSFADLALSSCQAPITATCSGSIHHS